MLAMWLLPSLFHLTCVHFDNYAYEILINENNKCTKSLQEIQQEINVLENDNAT